MKRREHFVTYGSEKRARRWFADKGQALRWARAMRARGASTVYGRAFRSLLPLSR